MQIFNMLYNPGPAAYYSPALRGVLEDHMTFLRTHPETQAIAVSDLDLYRFEGDLYGLFTELGIPPQYHFVVMRVNGLDSPLVVSSEMRMLWVPSYTVVDQIRQASHTTGRLM